MEHYKDKHNDILLINSDCSKVISLMKDKNIYIDGVITSPPYNTSRTGRTDKLNSRYATYKDNLSNEDYIDWQVKVFNEINSVLVVDGSILFNISYSSENTDTMWLLIADIIKSTPFTVADHIVWKKRSAIPNNRSKNKLTRITESVFVFARKSEITTFKANKQVKSIIEKTGQNNYENVYNFIEADNSDKGEHKKNLKATFSTDLVTKLINIYYQEGDKLFDPFSGSGTTALSCFSNKLSFIGSELDLNTHNIAVERVKNLKEK